MDTVSSQNISQNKEYSYTEAIFAYITFILGFLFVKLFPAAIRPLGSLLFILIMFISAFVFMMIKDVKPRLLPAIIPIVLSFALVLNTNFYINTIIFIYVALSYAYWIFSSFGNNLGKNSLVFDTVKALFLMPFSEITSIFFAAVSAMRHGGIKKVLFALGGLIAAVVPTSVIILLLSYDAGFSEIIDNIISSPLEFIAENIPLFIVSIPVSMYFYGLLYSCSNNSCKDKMTADSCEKTLNSIKVIPIIATVFALLPVFAVYIIYFFSQSSYYLSAFSKTLPEGLSYAEYARSGFFELCTVSVINALLVAAVNGLTEKTSKAAQITVKIANFVFPLSTLILIITAISKMILYIDTYGLTEKRVLATWLMVMLFFGFVIFILKQFLPKIKLGISYLLLFLIFTLPLSFCNVNGVIAKYNVDNYLNGSLEQVDIYALRDLGASAVPSLIKLGDSGNVKVEADVERVLSDYEFPEDVFEVTVPDFIAKGLLKERSLH